MHRIGCLSIVLAVLLPAFACTGAIDDGTGTASDPIASGVTAAKQATSAFHDRSAAEAAGYGDSGLPCIPNMGFHWLNPSYLGGVDPTKPAALVYTAEA